MNRLLMVKIPHLYVANPGNSLAISYDWRLDLKDFTSSSSRPGINQRFLYLICFSFDYFIVDIKF